MNILITGGAGFIGSHLAEDLVKDRKNNITIIDNLSTGRKDNLKAFLKKIKFVKVDLKSNIEKYFKNVDVVYHIAALADIVPSIIKPKDYFNSNVLATQNVLEACVKHNIKKIVYTASSSCYGIPKKFPTNEEQKIQTLYPYALTKKIGEDLIMHWGKVYKINVTSLRLFNVYGTRSRTSGTYGAMFGVFLKQKISNQPFTVVGDGSQKRDFTYVTDVVRALKLASKYKKSNQIFNVGSGKTVSINKICNLLKGKKIYIPKRPGEPDITFADTKKIKKELMWKPKISINEGIGNLLSNIDYWNNAPLWTKSKIKIATKDWFKYLS